MRGRPRVSERKRKRAQTSSAQASSPWDRAHRDDRHCEPTRDVEQCEVEVSARGGVDPAPAAAADLAVAVTDKEWDRSRKRREPPNECKAGLKGRRRLVLHHQEIKRKRDEERPPDRRAREELQQETLCRAKSQARRVRIWIYGVAYVRAKVANRELKNHSEAARAQVFELEVGEDHKPRAQCHDCDVYHVHQNQEFVVLVMVIWARHVVFFVCLPLVHPAQLLFAWTLLVGYKCNYRAHRARSGLLS